MKNHEVRVAKLEETASRRVSGADYAEVERQREKRWALLKGLAEEIMAEENGQPTGTVFRDRVAQIPSDDLDTLRRIRKGLRGMSQLLRSDAIMAYRDQLRPDLG